MPKAWPLLAAALLLPPLTADARGGGSHGGGSHSSSSHSSSSRTSNSHSSSSSHTGSHSTKATGVQRDTHGRIKRSAQAKHDFQKTHPCPATGRTSGRCPGYVIDHVQPLKRGGSDRPSNMQWQTKEAARIKDKTE